MADQTKFNSQLEVTQTVTLGGSLDVSGTTTFNNQVAIVATDDTVSIVATGVSITGTTTITGKVTIQGDTFTTGTVTISGNINASGTVTITGDLSCTSLQLIGSDRLTDVLTKTEQIYFGNIAGNGVGTYNCSIAGVILSNFNSILVDTPDILNDAFIVQGVVTADDVVSLKLHNTSNATVEAITATFRVVAFQFS